MFKKQKVILSLAAIVIGVCAIIIYYFVSIYKPKDVSDKIPYVQIINTKLVTIEAAIVVNNSTGHYTNEYANELQDFNSIDTTVAEFITIPKGSVLEFKKAVQVNHFISGHKYVYLLGNLLDDKMKNKTPIIYQWGFFKTICIEDDCDYWEHRKAPWQDTIDQGHYK